MFAFDARANYSKLNISMTSLFYLCGRNFPN